MIYADYKWYSGNFHGSLIPESEFERRAAGASEYMRCMTFGRITDGISEFPEIKNCCCAIAEADYNYSQKAGIASEKTGSCSVSYNAKNPDDFNKERRNIINIYLGNTGLLFRGTDDDY